MTRLVVAIAVVYAGVLVAAVAAWLFALAADALRRPNEELDVLVELEEEDDERLLAPVVELRRHDP